MDGENDWYEKIYTDYTKVDIGFSLGTGSGRHQLKMIDDGFVRKWDSIDLVINRAELNKIKNVKGIKGDLNFIELPSEKYNLILRMEFYIIL